MTQTIKPIPAISMRALREALMAPPPVASPPPPPAAPPPITSAEAALLPTPPELLEASPNLQRLCEGFHRTHRQMITRSRRQKLGIAVLVAAIGVGTLVLGRSTGVSPVTLADLMLAVGGASCASLGILALLWVRDDRRLRAAQGERMMRALQFNCALDDDRLDVFRRHTEPTTAFFDCYRVWCGLHPSPDGAVAALIAAITQNARRRAAAH